MSTRGCRAVPSRLGTPAKMDVADEGAPYHPKTRVDFAGTAAFTRKWGVEEAEKAQRGFERPTWHKSAEQKTPSPGVAAQAVPPTKSTLSVTTLDDPKLFILAAFVLGFAAGWMATK